MSTLTPEQINVIRRWINEQSLQYYKGVFSMVGIGGVNEKIADIKGFFSDSPAVASFVPPTSTTPFIPSTSIAPVVPPTTSFVPPTASFVPPTASFVPPTAPIAPSKPSFLDMINQKAFNLRKTPATESPKTSPPTDVAMNGMLKRAIARRRESVKNDDNEVEENEWKGGGKLDLSKVQAFKDELNNENFKFPDADWTLYVNNDITTKDKFVKRIIAEPLDVLCYVNAKKIRFDGNKFIETPYPKTDEQKFINLLTYYLNLNQVWQRVFNTIQELRKEPSTQSSTGTSSLYTYNKSALGTSSFDVTNFRPWNTFGVVGFGKNPNFFPYGGNILPVGIVGGTQRGGSGQTCGQMIKNVVDSVIASSGGVDGDVKKRIDAQLNENIKYETLINQKLQQIVTISQTPMGGNNLDVTKYLGELQNLLTFLKDNQSLLFNTLRLSVSPTAIGYKLNQPQTNYRSLGDMLPQVGGGTPEQTAQMLDLLQRIATKLNA